MSAKEPVKICDRQHRPHKSRYYWGKGWDLFLDSDLATNLDLNLPLGRVVGSESDVVASSVAAKKLENS